METPTHHSQTDLTPDRLAVMRLNINEANSEIYSAAGTPGAFRKSDAASYFGREASWRTSMTRSSRRQSGFAGNASFTKFSAELTHEAEAKFRGLMELMSSASQEASSLKSIWERINLEREMFAQEREDLMSQVTEVTTEMTRREDDRSRHSTELVDKKKQIEKLVVDLSTALAGVATEKKRVADRDADLEHCRHEIQSLKESTMRSAANYERAREELEKVEFKLKSVEEDRDTIRDESERHHRELQKTLRERTEVTSKLVDVTQKFDVARKDAVSLTDRIKVYEVEREESIHELERLKEEARKLRAKAAEASKGSIEATEKYERVFREHNKLKETLRLVESERDEHMQVVESLRREIKDNAVIHEEANERLIEAVNRYEASKREIITVRDALRAVELERNEILGQAEASREAVRVITLERDETVDELTTATKRVDEHRRQVTITSETLRKTEETLSQVRTETLALTERCRHADHERDDARHKHRHALGEIDGLRERILVLEHEVKSATESRNATSAELERVRSEFSEVTETITSYRDEGGDMELEIENLRIMLRETREQKERAIAARHSADRERDEYVSRYEDKCRELDRFEESMHSHLQSSRSNGGEMRTSRIISKSTTNGGFSSSSAHNHVSSSSHEAAQNMSAETTVSG